MSDITDTQASQETTTPPEQASAEVTAADSQSENQTGSQDQAGSESQASKADDSGKGKPEPSNASSGTKEQPKESGSPQDSKPKVRGSARYRIEQLVRENALLRKKHGEPERTDDNQDQGNNASDESQGKQPDISKLVAEEVERRLNPVLSEHSKAADDSEINDLFTGEHASKRAEFEPKIRESWKLPQYKDLAASDVFKILNYDQALANAKAQAVEEYKKADKDAKDSSGSGTSARKEGKEKTAWDLSDEEFKQVTDKVRSSG